MTKFLEFIASSPSSQLFAAENSYLSYSLLVASLNYARAVRWNLINCEIVLGDLIFAKQTIYCYAFKKYSVNFVVIFTGLSINI